MITVFFSSCQRTSGTSQSPISVPPIPAGGNPSGEHQPHTPCSAWCSIVWQWGSHGFRPCPDGQCAGQVDASSSDIHGPPSSASHGKVIILRQ
jgi:hypothetical protein